MQTLVIYDSKFGNTEKVAEAIGRGAAAHGGVRVLSTTDAASLARTDQEPVDLLLVGGPTHNHGISKTLGAFLDALPGPLTRIPSAAFDTRYRGPAFLMGSAAAGAARLLLRRGGPSVASPESFFIVRRGKVELQGLEPGELERAEQWGSEVAATAASAIAGPVAPAR